MNKTKKIIIGVVLGCVLLGGLGFGGFYYYKLNKVSTVLTIDINPSLKLSLNYKDEVIKSEGLNEDGKNLIKAENFKGNDLEDAIEEIAELSVQKGYVKEKENNILVNVQGKDINERVVNLINKEFNEEKVECNVILQEINSEAKANAEKYGISESKASFIEEVIKQNNNLTFEDLKDKSINEINSYIESKEEPKQEEDNKQNNSSDNNASNNSNNKPNTNKSNTNNKPSVSSYVCPTSPSNENNVWCDYFDRTEYETFARKYNCKMNEKKDYETLRQMALKHLGIQSIEARGQYSYPKIDSRGSYCSVQTFIITTTETRTTLVLDSVTGEVIEESSIPVIIKLSEEDAVDALLKHYNLSRDDLESYSTWFSTDNEGLDFIYKYSVYLTMKDGTRFSKSINANTGEIVIY